MDTRDGISMTKAFRYFLYFLIGLVIGACSTNNVRGDAFSVELNNDTLTIPRKDSEYTHGTEFTYMRDTPFLIFSEYGFQLQQNMYGPKLIKTDELQNGEHPYCGYLSFNLIGDQWFELSWCSLSIQHKLGLGCVGPHSYAKESQRIIHSWLGCKDPKGWDRWQIRDEPIVQYESWVNFNIELLETGHFKIFGIPRAGVDIGGFKDMLAAGLDLKLGLDPSESVGHGVILSAPMGKKAALSYSAYFLVGLEGRCVLHDTSIDGGFFRDSPYTNESETWVGEAHFGAGVKIKRLELEYITIKRTNEFKTEVRRPSYGKLLLRWGF